MTRADIWDIRARETAICLRETKEVVRQKIIAARDLIKCHPLTPELATELFTSKGMGVFCFSAALMEWSECELNDVKRLCVQAYKNAWHLPRSTASALFIFPKTHAGKESTLPMASTNIESPYWRQGIVLPQEPLDLFWEPLVIVTTGQPKWHTGPAPSLPPDHYGSLFGFPPKNGVTPKLPSEVAQCL